MPCQEDYSDVLLTPAQPNKTIFAMTEECLGIGSGKRLKHQREGFLDGGDYHRESTALLSGEVRVNSFIHSFHSFIQAISIAPLQVHYYSEVLRTQHRCWVRVNTPKRKRQLRVKDLPKVPTWRLERDSNSWPFGRKAPNLPMRHDAKWNREETNEGSMSAKH